MQYIDGNSLIKTITPEELKAAKGGEITFSACVHKLRKGSGFSFVILRTGRYLFQAVYLYELCAKPLTALCEGAYITVSGTVKEEKRADWGIEITLKDFEILSMPCEEYSVNVSDNVIGCNLDTELANRTSSLRRPDRRAVFKISEGIESSFCEFMLSENFTRVHTPKICAPIDNVSNSFKLKYFAKDSQLVRGTQLYRQMCTAFFDRVFEVGAVYRADKHNSTRHLNEYISLGFEMSFVNNISDIMQMLAASMKYILRYLGKNYGCELDLLGVTLPCADNIPSVTLSEALSILNKPQNQPDLDPTDQVKLCGYSKKEYGSDFIFVTHFPSVKRPFNIMDSEENPYLSESFDLLCDGLDIARGGHRNHSYEQQAKKLSQLNMNSCGLEDYLTSLKQGLPPHGGAEIGLERLTMKLLQLNNIRQASLFPRDMHYLCP